MPAAYTHYKFGRELIEKMPEDIQHMIKQYEQLFLIGLHGPDILFYYYPLKKNKVNQKGYRLHRESGKKFFLQAAQIIESSPNNIQELVYIYGVICHFSLDIICHRYIDNYAKYSGATHEEIEAELDRAFMNLDGKKPLITSTVKHIVPSLENSQVIYKFYEGISEKEVKQSLKQMILFNNLLLAPNKLKRKLLLILLKIVGKHDVMQGLFISFEPKSNCRESTQKLIKLYANAEKLALKLIKDYGLASQDNMKLDSIYDYTFCGIVYQEEEKVNEN